MPLDARWALLPMLLVAISCGSGSASDPADATVPNDANTPSDTSKPLDVGPAPDATPDATPDTFLDTGPDAAPDTIMAIDAAPDTSTAEDMAEDAATIADTVTDTARDTEPPADVPPEPWRSALYPADWTPAFTDDQGRYLPDFSYAGYRNGETDLAVDVPEDVLDVTDPAFGADATGESDSTAAVQATIDAAAVDGGAVVYFPEGLYRFDGALRIATSRTVLRGAGPESSRLWFTASEGRDYRAHVLFQGALQSGPDLPLAEDVDARAFDVFVADAGDLAPGDDVTLGQVITDEFIEDHAMTGTWQAFNGDWHPFYRRTVVAVDREQTPHRVTLDVPIRYPHLVRDGASLRRQSGALSEVGFESLGIADAVGWEQAWLQRQIHVVEFDGVKDSWMRDVATFRSPGAPDDGDGSEDHVQSGGLIIRRSKRVTVADVTVEEAQNRGENGNGYLFEVRISSEILFRDCVGRAGRHNFIQNWGFGATGIVWLRAHSSEGRAFPSRTASIAPIGFSEFHHSLATANLMDSVWVDDGWGAVNRGQWSTGAGHSATRSVFWNVQGTGIVNSLQYGWGYVIGTARPIRVNTMTILPNGEGTEPEDWTEGLGDGATLEPASLYEDQLARRLGAR